MKGKLSVGVTKSVTNNKSHFRGPYNLLHLLVRPARLERATFWFVASAKSVSACFSLFQHIS